MLSSHLLQCWYCGSRSPLRDDSRVANWRHFTRQLEVHDQRSRELYLDCYWRWRCDRGFLNPALVLEVSNEDYCLRSFQLIVHINVAFLANREKSFPQKKKLLNFAFHLILITTSTSHGTWTYTSHL